MPTPPAAESAPSPASAAAMALLAGLIRHGVTDLVLSPGSRSQALALAAAALARAGHLHLHVRIDERVAGFTALGLAVETGRPVAIVCTSGTAVANLHPAVLEAHHSGVPLIVLTADRPAELRGIGSNQTTVQPGIFGDLVRADWDVAAPVGAAHEVDDAGDLAELAVRAAAEGPVHVNLAYREPLSGAVELPADLAAGEHPAAGAAVDEAAPGDRRDRVVLDLEPDDATVVIAGTGAGPLATELAEKLGAPLIAEVASESRFGRHVVAAYREVLRGPHGDAVARAIVVGHPTLSREVPALLQRPDVEAIVIRTPGVEAYDPGRRGRIVDGVRVHGTPDPAVVRRWVGGWVAMSRAVLESEAPDDPAPDLGAAVSEDPSVRAAFARAEMAILRAPVDRRMLARALWASTWPHDRLVLGASRLIREADRIVPGKRIPVHANRGLAGIDGTISTAAGIALAARRSERHGVVRVLLGDLAAVHDAGALLVPLPDDVSLHVFVGDDGGGTIFDSLEVAATADADDFARVMRTPVAVDFAALAAAGGWEYRRVTTRAELDDALTARERLLLVHVPLEP
ncbi:2-succinyl-5-enolpyruvyl-6-hydroxy-3-cyclohexene-1-carboxylic-acid synthase [Microcella frigidaquae]|uniref:2-succinyl-5-enolpyruvyl-6-hydroxy-3-cyclohexene-1-carboxylate synthase n=1 Tax=Microcella frigidaquae TaxID=424758 RepID=A0A840XJ22_9MICO|nr:2-succinyl-5-enolpyruvyl-6-hydroxy-3-cyclohexene-1-carboxylic-acid synthase [Microcella frigidaquae]MBB5618306.1 2-succinyl-5-enolpyruvyl-6-hydroxy-3-cyclohexene-1-carboxylate synthase [Microcella frigidaquae]NHN44788.1 2-succinyl-5-enolpyruvyl-6-hydroxy-3-cyclohexene-1-carboxylic-acid synthase [Microcella frigidaquae]